MPTTTLPTLRAHLATTWQLFAKHFAAFFSVAAPFVFVLLILSRVFSVTSVMTRFDIVGDFLFVFLVLLLQLWLQAAIILTAELRVNLGSAIRQSAPMLWHLFLTGIVTLIVTSLPLVLSQWYWIGTFDPTTGAPTIGSTTTAILTTIALLWFLLVSTFFLFAPFIVVLEKKTWRAAIVRSFALARKRWTLLVTRYLLLILVFVIISAALRYIPVIGSLAIALFAPTLATLFFLLLYRPMRTIAP